MIIANIFLTTLFMITTAASANNDEADESFFEFLAEIEEIDNNLTHPLDFSDEDADIKSITGTSNE